MNLTSNLYDAIVSQPSHPWTSGASHLYTRDFFSLVHSKLEPGGIFVQWIGAGFVNVELFGSLMASMADVFPYVHVYRPVPAAMAHLYTVSPLSGRAGHHSSTHPPIVEPVRSLRSLRRPMPRSW